jgi:hypothetical protein
MLLRKEPEWYALRFPDAPEDEDYVWPVPRLEPSGTGPAALPAVALR